MEIPALKIYQGAIDADMANVFTQLPGLVGIDLSLHSLEAFATLREYCMRPGKRIRGSLASAAYDDAIGGVELDPAGVRLGTTLELIQSYLLIVDDVMDNAKLRRGKPSMHELFAREANKDHDAHMMAIDVGIITQHAANLLLLQESIDPLNVQMALKHLHANMIATGFGQLDDLYQRPGKPITMADILHKYELKSSYYTFINPLQCAFTLAGKGDERTLAESRQFGLAAGIVYQLRDDYIGLFSDSATTGKTSTDIAEGRYTLQVQYALEHGSEDDARVLNEILGNNSGDADAVSAVKDILNRSGATAYVKEQMENYARSATVQLSHAQSWSPKFSETLKQLVEYAKLHER